MLRYTLVTEGSSDIALMPIIDWVLRENGVVESIDGEWADLGEVRFLEKVNLDVKVREAMRLFPCDILFVHRDADRSSPHERIAEIESAIERAGSHISIPAAVCVIPIRMLEAWLLFDEPAIRYAAANRNSRIPLQMPLLKNVEELSDPKQVLYDLIKQASGLSGRKLKRLRVNQSARRVTEFVEDFSPLRELSAFSTFERDVQCVLEQFNLELGKS